MRIDVFISYSSRDKPVADALCATLEQSGIRCWIAPRDILPGRDWSEAIIDAITDCGVMVLLFSAHSNSSEQVKREVATAVSEATPLIPFRIEDVPLSKHMRYFIGTPHWLDALTPPLEKHLQFLSRTVRSLLEVREDAPGTSEPSDSSADARIEPVEQPSDTVPPAAAAEEQMTQLSLQFRLDEHLRNVCLIAQPIVTLGKERSNDIVLRVLPRSALHDEQSGRISRHHAEIRFSGPHVEWVNLLCSNGTYIDKDRLPSESTTVLHNGVTVSPAGALSVAVDVYAENGSTEGPALDPLDGTQLHASAVRLRRLDRLSGLEQYVVFDRQISLGSSADCPILIPGPDVAPHHADLRHGAGGFELLIHDSDAGSYLNNRRLTSSDPVPIRPGDTLRLGKVEIDVTEKQQLYLDFSPG
ncbi:FHA domain protein [Maioricimonas rarisocia]|uniref:FHA domain protein n=1 Tax=Maioricimonas rarisocia TaxID=2528026 RepID=A0A517ZB10_9PLAN|nr:FHA domain-containing protein [Maioricimonas rarisocia]QDU39621.1 FHA domain protein [Maioricimonas rarisocia]